MRKAQVESAVWKKLVDAARELMLAKGYTATSVDDICTAAGVTKGSFFHYFTDKEHLGRVAAERSTPTGSHVRESPAPGQERPPRSRARLHRLPHPGRPQPARGQGLPAWQLRPGTVEVAPQNPRRLRRVPRRSGRPFPAGCSTRPRRSTLRTRNGAPRASPRTWSPSCRAGSSSPRRGRTRGAVAENLGHFREYIRHLLGR